MKFREENEKDFCRIENYYGIEGFGTTERIMEMIDTCGMHNAQIFNDHRLKKNDLKKEHQSISDYPKYDDRNPRLAYEYDVESDIYSRNDKPAMKVRRRQG